MPSLGQSTKLSEIGRIHRLLTFAEPYLTMLRRMAAGRPVSNSTQALDYGCGDGTVLKEMILAGHGKAHIRLNGTDVQHHGAYWFRPRPSLASYDLVFNFDVLEHTNAPHAVLRMMRECLRVGGFALITVPNRWWFFETHAASPWNRLPFFNWGPWRHWLRHRVGRGVRCYTKTQLASDLSHHFEVDQIGYMVAPMDKFPILRPLFKHWHRTRLPFMATNIYAICRKREI